MKKQVKKLKLAKETVGRLEDLASVKGGLEYTDPGVCGGGGSEGCTSAFPYRCPRQPVSKDAC